MDFYQNIKEKFSDLISDQYLWSSQVDVVRVKPLTPKETIGNPERDDFPLLKGKEVMVQADFRGSLGQAYTDKPGNFKGTLEEVFQLPLTDNFQRAIFIASINAVLRYLGYISQTIHCRDKEPADCARQFKDYIKEQFGNPKIGFFGLQPAIVEALAGTYQIRVADLDKDIIGQRKNGVLIEDASHTKDIISWADLLIATGTTVVNNTIGSLLGKKPVIFYGVTISGVAYLLNYQQFCYCSH